VYNVELILDYINNINVVNDEYIVDQKIFADKIKSSKFSTNASKEFVLNKAVGLEGYAEQETETREQ
jgi:hypothetical protein